MVNIEKQAARILDCPTQENALKLIELAGRTCYQSENLIGEGTAEKFLRNRVYKDHHDTLLEHVKVTVSFITDRAVQNEIVRHRIASYCVESTRYCNYAKDKFGGHITVIEPPFETPQAREEWWEHVNDCDRRYHNILGYGETPEMARSVLPLSLKTIVVMTANLRELRYFFSLRGAISAHPQIRELSVLYMDELKRVIPIFFEDFTVEENLCKQQTK